MQVNILATVEWNRNKPKKTSLMSKYWINMSGCRNERKIDVFSELFFQWDRTCCFTQVEAESSDTSQTDRLLSEWLAIPSLGMRSDFWSRPMIESKRELPIGFRATRFRLDLALIRLIPTQFRLRYDRIRQESLIGSFDLGIENQKYYSPY